MSLTFYPTHIADFMVFVICLHAPAPKMRVDTSSANEMATNIENNLSLKTSTIYHSDLCEEPLASVQLIRLLSKNL